MKNTDAHTASTIDGIMTAMQNGNKPVVLITGSEGLIGRALVEACSSAYDVVGFDVKRPGKDPEKEDFIDCDLTKDESVDHALGQVREKHGDRIASVIHLAAYYDFSGEPSPLYRDLTVEGTRRLLKGLRSFHVEQFVFSSTHIVMKPSEEGEAITESSEVEPAWEYPKSKVEAEKVIAEERGSIPAVILRIAGVYDEDCHAVPIAQQIDRIYNKKLESFVFPGDASHGQAFVHLADLVDLLLRTITRRRDLAPYEVFLVAEPDVVSYDEFQGRLGELIHGDEWPTVRIPKTVAKAGAWVKDKLAGDEEKGKPFIKPWMIDLADDHYPLDITHAREKLGWEPQHRLRDSLPEMIRRLKSNPRKWYEVNGLPVPESIAPEDTRTPDRLFVDDMFNSK